MMQNFLFCSNKVESKESKTREMQIENALTGTDFILEKGILSFNKPFSYKEFLSSLNKVSAQINKEQLKKIKSLSIQINFPSARNIRNLNTEIFNLVQLIESEILQTRKEEFVIKVKITNNTPQTMNVASGFFQDFFSTLEDEEEQKRFKRIKFQVEADLKNQNESAEAETTDLLEENPIQISPSALQNFDMSAIFEAAGRFAAEQMEKNGEIPSANMEMLQQMMNPMFIKVLGKISENQVKRMSDPSVSLEEGLSAEEIELAKKANLFEMVQVITSLFEQDFSSGENFS